MKAVVTGAAGFIGSHLSAALLDSGATVTGIDCFTDYYPRPLKDANLATLQGRPGFTFIEGALEEIDLRPAVAGATHIFHLAAQAGVRKSWGRDFDVYTRNNVEATQRLLEVLWHADQKTYTPSSSFTATRAAAHARRRDFATAFPDGSRSCSEHLAPYWATGVPVGRCGIHRVWPRQRPDLGFNGS